MDNKLEAILTVGISASGKSTFAEKLVEDSGWVSLGFNEDGAIQYVSRYVEVNRDRVRKKLVEATGKEFTWANWKWKREGEVTAIIHAAISDHAKNKRNIVVSDTNLNPKTRATLTELLTKHGYTVTIKTFPISLEEAWARDAARANGVGHSVIAKQYNDWLAYIGRKTYVADKTQPACILVDIDGTLAHMNGKRGAFDWDKVGLDDVDHQVRFLINAVYDMVDVIVLSGRDGVCEPETRQWLLDNNISFNKLIMRAPNDMRKDTVVKEEIFWRDIADEYNVQFIIDDRPVVCDNWREMGLKVFQVGDPNIRF